MGTFRCGSKKVSSISKSKWELLGQERWLGITSASIPTANLPQRMMYVNGHDFCELSVLIPSVVKQGWSDIKWAVRLIGSVPS